MFAVISECGNSVICVLFSRLTLALAPIRKQLRAQRLITTAMGFPRHGVPVPFCLFVFWSVFAPPSFCFRPHWPAGIRGHGRRDPLRLPRRRPDSRALVVQGVRQKRQLPQPL